MSVKNIIVNIKNMDDIKSIDYNTKYINISIDEVDNNVIEYFILNGSNYLYSDIIGNKGNFIYIDYDTFKKSEEIVKSIIDRIPSNLNDIEKVRYIYISLGKIVSTDINNIDSKNESISFNTISTINNIWGCIDKKSISDISISKLFMYILSRLGIKSELINSSINGSIANKVYIDDNYLIVNLYNDIYNIQGGFSTKYFDKYNDNREIDKKIGYIKDDYVNYYLDNDIRDNLDNKNVLNSMLNITSKYLNINYIGTYELYLIYKELIDKYNLRDINIYNFFVYKGEYHKEHFIVIGSNDIYYSYNYNKGCFIRVDKDIIYDNMKNKKIGLYENEDFDIVERRALV